MRFKKIRFWMASKVLGGAIIEDTAKILEDAQHEWVKRQLALGNSITLEYKVTSIAEEKKKRKKVK